MHIVEPVIVWSDPPLPLMKPSMNYSELFKKHVNVEVQSIEDITLGLNFSGLTKSFNSSFKV